MVDIESYGQLTLSPIPSAIHKTVGLLHQMNVTVKLVLQTHYMQGVLLLLHNQVVYQIQNFILQTGVGWEVISWGHSAIFWFFTSTSDGSKDSALLMPLLSSPAKASQFPFVHQELYIVLCRCHGAWNRERWKIWLLPQKCSSLVPRRIKVNLKALPYQY